MSNRTVKVYLPVSKTDPFALGCSRIWGCTCLPGSKDSPCVFHVVLNQFEILKQMFGVESNEFPRDLPLFPTKGGQAASKVSVIDTVMHLVNCLYEFADFETCF